jgi:RND family efflux transporter MFP subunit
MYKRALLFVVAAVLLSCRRHAPPPAQNVAVKVGANDYVIARVERITTGPILSGNLSAVTEADVKAQIAGPLLDVNVLDGERVHKGQLLARIDPGALARQESAQAGAAAAARNNVALAQRELARQRTLYRDGIVAKATVDVAQQQVDAARSQLAQAQTQIAGTAVQASNATVESPIDGVVTKSLVSKGDVVTIGQSLFTIIDPAKMQLEASVPADNLGAIRPGTPIVFNVQGLDGKIFSGRIARVNPAADPTTRQIEVFSEIPNPGGVLASGLYAEGRVENMTRVGVVVPSAAIDHRMTTPSVTRVNSGHAEQVPVMLGLTDDKSDRVEIARGVNPGDILLVGSALLLAPGTPVELPAAAHTAGDVRR